MKTFLLFFFFISLVLYGQIPIVWTPPGIVNNLTVGPGDKIISYSNSYGTHLVINSNGTIRYILLSITGELIMEQQIDDECEYSYFITTAITAYQDELYIIYQKGNYIKVVKSINGGETWNYLTQKNMGSSICNGIDIAYDEKGLHVVWAVKMPNTDFEPHFETYYERYRRIEPAWVDFKKVTDEEIGSGGGQPTIALSDNRIHVNFNLLYYMSGSSVRDFDFISNEWLRTQHVEFNEPPPPVPGIQVTAFGSASERIVVLDGYLHVLSYVNVIANEAGYIYLYDKQKHIDSDTWLPEILLTKWCFSAGLPAVISSDQKLHVLVNTSNYSLDYYEYSEGGYSSYIQVFDWAGLTMVSSYCLSAYSNSLYAYWIGFIDLNTKLYFSNTAQNPFSPVELNQRIDNYQSILLNRQNYFFNVSNINEQNFIKARGKE
ncbi:MAG: hypothetical protein AUK34_01045 [Ignavibacteria bacterium CG2_30_36_16]|nr:hypothetical protein [Ignavibacteria bacterium]OIP63667.1 MAG: hypothetical protein AUK34_01045 [Ignavibacteria bacterium CG2_30_36_16]PJB01349.1 MAG: hypothetical protein CO127_04245 [Ignavibacteria bacterium CG_4_9_14_3_um_filter_36_18]